jgi:creatinine amidohydrolase/Fe(II)-dependent formamide hydrolase-like protein
MSAAQDYMVSRRTLRRFWRGRMTFPAGSPGSLGQARMASAEKGARIYERILDRISDRVLAAPRRAG